MQSLFGKSSSAVNRKSGENRSEDADGPHDRSPAADTASGFVANGKMEYGHEETGIKVTYVLTKEEIYECLKNTGGIKTGGKLFAAVNIVFTALAAAFLIYGRISGSALYFILSAVFISFILIFGFFPVRINKARAESRADGHTVCMSIYPRHIELGSGINKLNIPLDGTAESEKVGDMIVIVLKNSKGCKGVNGNMMAILPLRCLDSVLVPDVQAVIFSGTKHRRAHAGLL